ncbi:MAG: hypothetical protein C4542_08115 [Dehalococcoidia bacterium]|nr:MAG: hypothetical protein C4542_08115 [Dehalococcoidia bacterium]
MQTTSELTRKTMKMRTADAPPGEPAGHRLLIKIVNEEKRTRGNIIIPAEDKRACETGQVLVVGRNAFLGYGNDDPWCEAGDMIHFVRHSGKDVKFVDDLNEYRVINDEDVYYVLSGNGSGGQNG